VTINQSSGDLSTERVADDGTGWETNAHGPGGEGIRQAIDAEGAPGPLGSTESGQVRDPHGKSALGELVGQRYQ
jgi:hypothetical protein